MAFSGVGQALSRKWYERRIAPVLWVLLPLSWLVSLLAALRRALYRVGVLPSYRLSVPVIVVGNLTVGGSGKTPLVLWLVERLRQAGWHPGIISRGYGGGHSGVQSVDASSSAVAVGDEPLLLASRSGVPVFVGHDRVAAGNALLAAHPGCDVIVTDDGLQHYRLLRTVELAIFDGRGAGNGCLLPLGPLREPLHRLNRVAAVVCNGLPDPRVMAAASRLPFFNMRLSGRRFVALDDRQRYCDAEALRGRRLHAVAGIGDPARFFAQLEGLGLSFEAHPFPDHHRYSVADLTFAHDGVLLMTEKDAVKCAALTLGEAWILPVEAVIEKPHGGGGLLETILEKLNGRASA